MLLHYFVKVEKPKCVCPLTLKILTKFEDPTALRFPTEYHCKCVCRHCACTVSRDLCIGANLSHTFEIPDPDLPIHYTTPVDLRLREIELSAKIVESDGKYLQWRRQDFRTGGLSPFPSLPPSFSLSRLSSLTPLSFPACSQPFPFTSPPAPPRNNG